MFATSLLSIVSDIKKMAQPLLDYAWSTTSHSSTSIESCSLDGVSRSARLRSSNSTQFPDIDSICALAGVSQSSLSSASLAHNGLHLDGGEDAAVPNAAIGGDSDTYVMLACVPQKDPESSLPFVLARRDLHKDVDEVVQMGKRKTDRGGATAAGERAGKRDLLSKTTQDIDSLLNITDSKNNSLSSNASLDLSRQASLDLPTSAAAPPGSSSSSHATARKNPVSLAGLSKRQDIDMMLAGDEDSASIVTAMTRKTSRKSGDGGRFSSFPPRSASKPDLQLFEEGVSDEHDESYLQPQKPSK